GRSRNTRRIVYRIPSRSFARCFASSADSAAPSNDDDRPRSLSLLQRRFHKRLRNPAFRSWTQDSRRRSYHCGIADIGPREAWTELALGTRGRTLLLHSTLSKSAAQPCASIHTSDGRRYAQCV